MILAVSHFRRCQHIIVNLHIMCLQTVKDVNHLFKHCAERIFIFLFIIYFLSWVFSSSSVSRIYLLHNGWCWCLFTVFHIHCWRLTFTAILWLIWSKKYGTLREVMYTMEDFAEIVRVILLALFIQCVHTIIHGSYRLCWRILSFSMNWLVLLYHVHQEVNNVADWWTKNGVNQLSITFYVWFCIPLQFYLSVPLHSSFPQQNEVSFTFHQKIKTRSFYVMMEWKDSILSSSITKQLLE